MQSASPPSTLRSPERDLTKDLDLTQPELVQLLDAAAAIKQNTARYSRALQGRYISLLFEKPSLRTRLTFELAIKQLGGDAVASLGTIGGREPLQDIARNLDRWTHAIVARTFKQETIDALAQWSSVPVINALSDKYHPCQALADMQTLRERFSNLRTVKLAFIGDGNNVAHSLMLCTARLGIDFRIATPVGYGPDPAVVSQAQMLAAESGSSMTLTNEPLEAVSGANAIYTDVWASMGQESEAAQRSAVFDPYQVNEALMEVAETGALFMHCLPAHRGDEVTEGVIESQNSVVFDQAENRLHAQKALLLMLMGGSL